jgi:hypothetical protein
MASGYVHPYIVIWELHERSEIASDPNPLLTTKNSNKSVSNKWSSMLNMPFSQNNSISSRISSDIPTSKSTEDISSIILENNNSILSKSLSISSELNSNTYDDVDEDDFKKLDVKIDTSAYPIWTYSLLGCIEKYSLTVDMSDFRSSKQIVNSNPYLKDVKKISLEYITSNNPQCKFSRHWTSWYRNPYFHLFIVKCEDNDEYKNYIKLKLRIFMDYMYEKDYSYLIIYVQQPSRKFSIFRVFNQLTRDFSKEKDRIVCISSENFTEDFIKVNVHERIRDGVIFEFTRRIAMYEKEIKKSESNRALPGWQFCHFFLIKEGLAFTFEQFKLYVKAHAIYNELTGFMNEMRDSLQFSKFIDDELYLLPILDTNAKDYKQKNL